MQFVGRQGACIQALNGDLSPNTVVMVKPNAVYQDKLLVSTNEEQKIGNINEIGYFASVGKVLTAQTAYQFFKDKGGLDVKVSDLIENYKIQSPFIEEQIKTLPQYKDTTIANLLNHTSGLAQFSQEGFDSLIKQNSNKLSSEDILASKLDKAGEFGKHNYSNVGYELCGLLMEKISGKSLESLQRDLVLKPHKLENEIFLRDDIVKNQGQYKIKNHPEKQLLLGRHFDGTKENEVVNLSHHAGAGMYANPQSIAKLAKAVWTPDFLQETLKYEVLIGENTKYGIGYIKNGNMLNHDGGMDGSGSSVMFDLEKNQASSCIVTLEDRTPKLVPFEGDPQAQYEGIIKKREELKTSNSELQTSFIQKLESDNPNYTKPTISSLLKEGKEIQSDKIQDKTFLKALEESRNNTTPSSGPKK